MIESETHLWNFPDVDRTVEPSKLIDFLDHAFLMNGVQDFKNQSYELLNVKQGEKVLDVGCGTGHDVRHMAEKTGSQGLVVGVDNSEIMISEARKRSESSFLKTKFCVADVSGLPFPDNRFDACRSERLFVHLKDPQKALTEMIRVLRPNGRILCVEGDFETVIIDHPARRLTRKILNYLCDSLTNGWIGRQLPNLFKTSGLTDLKVLPINLVLLDFASSEKFWMLTQTVQAAEQDKIISAAEADAWLNDLKEADRAGLFFGSMSGIIILGSKNN